MENVFENVGTMKGEFVSSHNGLNTNHWRRGQLV